MSYTVHTHPFSEHSKFGETCNCGYPLNHPAHSFPPGRELLVQEISDLKDVAQKHPTEIASPQQCEEFRKIIESMYSLHLDKNQDYSPMNILATGMTGVVTRIWDKVARLMNLSGFDIRTGEYRAPKDPKNESLEDTFLDLANYAVIALIMRRGKWGK